MNTLKTIGRNAVLFAIGGTIYYMIELIYMARVQLAAYGTGWRALLLVLWFDK